MTTTEPDLRSIWSHLDNLAFTQGYVDAAGVRTRYVHAGPADAPPLVMVHGMGGSWENFIGNFAAHAQHFNTYAFDFVGHGYSEKPDHPYSVSDYRNQLEGFIAAMGLRQVNLMGLSLGGWVSTSLTVRRPELVDKLLVMSAWGRPRPEQTPEEAEMQARMIADRMKSVDEPTWDAINKVFEGLIGRQEDRVQDLLALRLRLYRQPGMATTMRNVFASVAPAMYDQHVLHDDDLRGISRPMMVVACVDHPDLFLASAYEYRDLVPGVQFVELRGAFHWPQWENADELNQISLDFFRS